GRAGARARGVIVVEGTLWPALLFTTVGLATAGVAALGGSRTHRRALAGRARGRSTDEHVALRHRVNSAVTRRRWGARLAVKLTASGVEMGPGDFMGVLCGVALGAFALVSAVLSGRLAVVGAGGAVLGVFLWVRRKRDQRRDRFVAQLPELARVLSNAASAGLATR